MVAATSPRALAGRLRAVRLFDTYGRLLTDRQQGLVRLYVHDDLSLSEIAERFGVTRQAVYDALRRATDELERLEALLKVVHSAEAAGRRQRGLVERIAALEGAVARLAGRVGAASLDEIRREVAAVRRAAQ